MEMDDLYRAVIQKYGKEHQIGMAFEEMAELQKALCKNMRGADNVADIAEEIADVRIMLDQMEIIFDCRVDVKNQREFKLSRLALRVKDGGTADG